MRHPCGDCPLVRVTVVLCITITPVVMVDPSGLRYVWIRDYGDVTWNSKTSTATLNGVDYYQSDGKGTFIQNGKMYVWDETLYSDMGWHFPDRNKAVNYALQYTTGDTENPKPNPKFNYYLSNCTNFVSQCLLDGGFNMDAEWWYDYNRKHFENSAAWGVADNLYRYLTKTLGFSVSYVGNKGEISSIYSKVQIGDVIAWNNLDDVAPGVINHTAIVSKVQDETIYYCGNTSDRHDYPLSNSNLNGSLYFVHIKYPDE